MLTSKQKVQAVKLLESGTELKNLAKALGVSFTAIANTPVIMDELRKSQRAWVTMWSRKEQADYVAAPRGVKAHMTRRMGKVVADPKPATKKTRKVVTLEEISFKGTLKIDRELMKYLHVHPNGKEITFAQSLGKTAE